jgi:hypothetical protein
VKELLSSLLVVSAGGVIDSGMGGLEILGEDPGRVSADHGRCDFKKVPNSGPMLRIRLVLRLAGRSGKALLFSVPVLERRFNCFFRSARGRLGAT